MAQCGYSGHRLELSPFRGTWLYWTSTEFTTVPALNPAPGDSEDRIEARIDQGLVTPKCYGYDGSTVCGATNIPVATDAGGHKVMGTHEHGG